MIALLSVIAYILIGAVFAGVKVGASSRKDPSQGEFDVPVAFFNTALWPIIAGWAIGLRIEEKRWQKRSAPPKPRLKLLQYERSWFAPRKKKVA